MLQDQEIPASTASRSASAPSRTGSEACKPVSAEAAAAAARSGVVEARRVQRERDDARRAPGSAIRSWSSTSSASGGIGCPGAPLDLGRAGAVAEDERVRRGAVVEAERDTRVRRVDE